MKSSRVHLPFAGGNSAERLLRNRGRLRALLARHHAQRLQAAATRLLQGAWQAPALQTISPTPVSLASWRPRLSQLPLVLITLLQQSLRPAGIFVWLTAEDLELIPESTRERFQAHHVRFSACDDLKPHKKWLPMIESGRRDPFVICDDDIIYPPDWFASLLREARDDAYVGLRCHRVTLNSDRSPAPYAAWPKMIAHDGRPSHDVFVTSGAGAILHPARIPARFLDRGEILGKCPNADDVWLKAAHLAAGVPCYKTRAGFPCLELPGTHASGLANANVDGGDNDRQIRNLQPEFSLIAS